MPRCAAPHRAKTPWPGERRPSRPAPPDAPPAAQDPAAGVATSKPGCSIPPPAWANFDYTPSRRGGGAQRADDVPLTPAASLSAWWGEDSVGSVPSQRPATEEFLMTPKA